MGLVSISTLRNHVWARQMLPTRMKIERPGFGELSDRIAFHSDWYGLWQCVLYVDVNARRSLGVQGEISQLNLAQKHSLILTSS